MHREIFVVARAGASKKLQGKPGYTLASVIANEFTEATTDIYLEALFEIGLVLFGVTILVNLIAQLLLKTMTTTTSATRAVQ